MREMISTNIQWIPLIPAKWSIARMKDIIAILTDYTANGSFGDLAKNVQYLDYEDYARLIRLTDLREQLKNAGVYVNEESYEYLSKSKLYGGEILVANVGAYAGLFCEMPEANMPSTLGPNMFLIKTNDKMLQHFLLYLGNTSVVWEQLRQKAISSAQPKLNKTDIKTTYILIPPLSEQRHIADFLDTKCAEIDALTADIQAQIDTLEQYKRSVITETVTKGLNPDAEMKDSGIEWIGVIPNEWAIRKGKYMFTQRSLRGNSAELQLLSPTQKFGVIPQTLYEELSGMTAVKLNEKADLNTLKTIHKGDFCISLRSFQGGFEYCEYEGVVSPAYQVFCPTVPIADGYYKYLFKESGFIEKMNSYTMTLRDGKNIAFSDFGNTYIPYPPVEIQSEIALHLDKKCSEINKVIMDKQAQLVTLDEYKKSLIFEYVTGKKEVPVS